MKPTLIVIALSLVLFGNSAFAAKTLEELTRQKNCITEIENLLIHFNRANAIWLEETTDGFSIERRFGMLKDLHDKYRYEVFGMAKDFEKRPGTPEQALTYIRDLESEHKTLLSTIEYVSEADAIFITSMEAIDEAYAHVGDRALSLTQTCKGFLDEELVNLGKNIKEIQEHIAQMRGYVTIAGQKRSFLFLGVYHGIKSKLVSDYSDLQLVPISEAKRQVESILYVDQFMDRVESWWKKASKGSGLGSNLISKYIQYFLPIRTMHHDLLAGKELDAEILNQNGIDPHLKQSVRNELAVKIGALETEIKVLEERGPDGNLNLQKMTTKRRKTILSQLGPTCSHAISTFEDEANKSNTDLTITEQLYAASVTACQKRSAEP
jgi:hypothetical protein